MKALLQKLRIFRIKKFINHLHSEISEKIKVQNKSLIEFGNLRKSGVWAKKEPDTIKWVYEIDVLSEKPLSFSIIYNILDKTFSCYSQIGLKNDISNILQFQTKNYDELFRKILELSLNIPALRERMMREYVYLQSGQNPKQKWKTLFKKDADKDKEKFLIGIVNTLESEKKISTDEKKRLYKYIESLLS
ncbi:MAG: hypothetical protein OEZ13_00460 [Spirochaetia bacterium]|nr:hypothetical protein [Spirochaetia bacterium]